VSTARPRARLVCQAGELAGTSFDLGEDTTIGSDPSHDIVFQSSSLSPDHARIRFQDGEYRLEDLGSGGGILVDGLRVDGSTRLGRIHVIELSDALEFVFIREEQAAAGQGGPTPEAPAEEEPRPGPEAGHTVVDMKGFGDLPNHFRKDPAKATQDEEKEPAKPPEREPEKDAGEPPEAGHTVVDMKGFGALPDHFDRGAGKVQPPREIHLEMTSSQGESRSFQLGEGEHVLGRGSACDITLPDPDLWLSREHAVIRVRKDMIELEDLESLNGTFVQGRKIGKEILEPGSSFSLGPQLNFKLRGQ